MKDMLGRTTALEAQEALSLILDSLDPPDTLTESIPIEESCGRVLSETLVSPEDLPGFARSTMDGFAVMASDTFGASETSPAYLEISGEILMGQEPELPLKPGHAIRIATGGMLPEGADAVLMFEYATEVDSTIIEAQKPLAPGENVIQRGDDLHSGEPLLHRGTRLRPQDVAVLASAGIVTVNAYVRPSVSIISTGNEIVNPSDNLRPGLIRDSNSYLLAAEIDSSGAVGVKRGIIPDSFDEICDTLEKSARESDLVLISGGSSVGTRDMTEKAIKKLGAIMFHSVRIKPGKPFLAGSVNSTPVFGLPGHPRAVAVCYEVFVRPTLARLSGERENVSLLLRGTVTARMKKNVHSTAGRREYIDIMIERTDGVLWAEPLLGKSGLLRTIVNADGRVCIPVGKPGLETGETVTVTLF